MKKLKKLAALVLAAAMVLAMGMTSFAAGTNKITINGGTHSLNGVTFTAYRLFDATEGADHSIGYTVTAPFKTYLANKAGGTSIYDYVKIQMSAAGTAQKFLSDLKTEIDSGSTVTDEDTVKATTTVSTETTTTEISGLEPGFYVIYSSDKNHSTMTVTVLDAEETVNVKVKEPGVEKEIIEDNVSAGAGNDYEIGDTVKFRVTVDIPTVGVGFSNYYFKFHDTMSDGLTLNQDSFKLYIENDPSDILLTENTDYKEPTIDANAQDKGNIVTKVEIDFVTGTQQNGWLSSTLQQNAGKQIVIEYTATINEKALHTNPETNSAKIDFTNNDGSKGEGTPDTTKIYTHEMIIQKYKDDAQTGNELAGAEFQLYKVTGNGADVSDDPIKVVQVTPGTDGAYRVAKTDEEGTATTTLKAAASPVGKITVEGLDSGWYAVVETKVPDGVNGLDAPEYIEIKGGLDANGDPDGENYKATVTLNVINKAGSLLPETGGMGTVLFTVIGAVLIIAVGTSFVVSRKRRAER